MLISAENDSEVEVHVFLVGPAVGGLSEVAHSDDVDCSGSKLQVKRVQIFQSKSVHCLNDEKEWFYAFPDFKYDIKILLYFYLSERIQGP